MHNGQLRPPSTTLLSLSCRPAHALNSLTSRLLIITSIIVAVEAVPHTTSSSSSSKCRATGEAFWCRWWLHIASLRRESAMALGQAGKFALVVAFPGVLAFILGIIAENEKPAGDLALKVLSSSGMTTCLYPKDPTPALGSTAAIFLFISAVIAVISLIYPYEGRSISVKHLAKSPGLVAFVVLSVVLFFVAEALLLWATILESVHRKHNHHVTLDGSCPTAKAGLFGGAAFMALDSTLFWLICLMLTINARADHFGYGAEDVKGNYQDVTTADYGPALGAHGTPKV